MKVITVRILAALVLVGVLSIASANAQDWLGTVVTHLEAALGGRQSAGNSPAGSSAAARTADSSPLNGHGIVEAQDDVVISAEIGGRVAFVGARLGDTVEVNATLVRLDDELALAQIDQAQAAVEAAQANLAYTTAAAQPAATEAAAAAVDAAGAQVEAAKTAVDTAAANLDAAEAGVKAAQARYDKVAAGATTTELELANKQVELAASQLWAAQATRDATRNGIDNPLSIPLVIDGDNLGTMVIENPVGPQQADVQAAEAAIVEAEGAIRTAELQVQKLKNGPSSEELAVAQAGVAKAQADMRLAQLQKAQAEQAVVVAEAQLDQAEAQAGLPLAGPQPEDIAIAQAKVAEAQAQESVLEASRSKLTLVTPIAGMVTERLVHEGEVVVPGARLLTISALDPVRLTVYIAEADLSRVRLGQEVRISTEAYPGETFPGQVVQIASEAEFTPRNIQADDQGVGTVFAVHIRVPNPDRKLRPGMAATAEFR